MKALHFPTIESGTFGDEDHAPYGDGLEVASEQPRPPRLHFTIEGSEGSYLDEPEVKRLVKYLQKWMAGVHGSTVAPKEPSK